MSVVFVFHHGQDPVARAVPLRPRFPFAADESLLSVLPYARLVRQLPVVDVVAAAVAAHVCDASFVIVAGGHAGVAVEAGVVLTGLHELLEVGVLAGGRGGHAVVGVCGVGWEGGRWSGGWDVEILIWWMRRIVVLSKVVHDQADACKFSSQCILFFWPSI